jgi:hypothetical protein
MMRYVGEIRYGVFGSVRWAHSPAETFDDRSDQSICCRVGNKYPKQRYADVKVGTHHDHRASESYKCPNDGCGHGDWRRSPRQGIDPPGNCYEKSDPCPRCNSAFQNSFAFEDVTRPRSEGDRSLIPEARAALRYSTTDDARHPSLLTRPSVPVRNRGRRDSVPQLPDSLSRRA